MKKTITQRFFLSLCLMIVGCLWGSSAWAEELAIDFESAASTYTDWTFTNMTSKQKDKISAHSGSYYGWTAGKASGSIATKNLIAYPSSITFYISKETDNVTSSSWKIQVSSDNSAWTDVKTISATSMSKGTWVKVTQDLSAYKNVYVRIYYTGSTAKRSIDDLSLTYTTTAPTTLKVSESAIGFGNVEIGQKPTKTITISGTSLTENASLSLSGDDSFSVDKNNILRDAEGNIEETNVTVTYAPTTAGEHSATLTIASGGISKEVSLTGTGVTPKTHYTVTWMVNGTLYTEGTPSTDVAEGEKVETLPDNPAAIGSKVFMGWTASTISGTSEEAPADLFTTAADAPSVTGNTTYYAVFAKLSSSTSSWNRVKTLAEITEGSYVIKNDTYILPSTKTTSGPEAVTAPTITGNEITGTVEESMIWQFTSTGTTNQFFIKNTNGDYLYAKSDNDGIRVSSTSDKWTFSENTTTYFSMKEATNSRYCAKYNGGNDWRSYTSAKHQNYANGGKLELYKLFSENTYSDYATTVVTMPASNIHATTYYKQITSTDELVDGGQYVIVYAAEYKGLLAGASNVHDATPATVVFDKNGTITTANAAAMTEITFEKDTESTSYYLNIGDGKYIKAVSASDTPLNIATGKNKNALWTIDFDAKGNVEITSKTYSARGILYYTSSNAFKNYAVSNRSDSGYPAIQLYQKVGEMPIAQATGGITTYVADFAYSMPQHLVGHTVTLADKAAVITTYKAFRAGDEVPALTPLLIKSTEDFAADETKTYNPAVLNKSVAAYEDDNMLEYQRDASNMTKSKKTGNVYYYKLAIKGGKVGFYWGAEGGAAFQMTKPSTAYLTVLTSSMPVQGFVLNLEEGETTGITTVVTNENAPIYNLQGIRMNGKNLPKGIYIQGGKKFMVK